MNAPDLVGLTLESAKNELSKFDLHVKILETFAPKEKTPTGECRVVKQVLSEDCVELTIGYF